MKLCFTEFLLASFLTTIAAFAQDQASAAPAPAPSVNQLKVQNANLAMQNAQLSAHIEGLQKELEATRTQVNQLQSNAVVSELCSAAGIAVKECSVAPDGTVSKLAPPPAAAAPPEPSDKAKPKQ